MTHKSGVEGSTSRLARVLLTEHSIIFYSCNVLEIKICRRGSDRQRLTFQERPSLKRRKVPYGRSNVLIARRSSIAR